MHLSTALAASHRSRYVVLCLHSVPSQQRFPCPAAAPHPPTTPPHPAHPTPPPLLQPRSLLSPTHCSHEHRTVSLFSKHLGIFTGHSLNDVRLSSTAVREPTAPNLDPVPFVDTRGTARNDVCLGQCFPCTRKARASKRPVSKHSTLTPLHFLLTRRFRLSLLAFFLRMVRVTLPRVPPGSRTLGLSSRGNAFVIV